MARRPTTNAAPPPEEPEEVNEEPRKAKKANPLGAVPIKRYAPRVAPFIWDGMIIANEVNLISGAGGSGKSTLAIHLAAKLTTGEMEGDMLGTPINVLYATTENDPNTAIRPKVTAAGGDLDRFTILGSGSSSFTLPKDLPKLMAHTEATDTRVVVLDPLMAYLDQDRSLMTNYAYVQSILNEITDHLRKQNVTLIGISHTGKNTRKAGTDAQVGSVAFTTTARCVVMVGKTHDGFNIAGVTKSSVVQPFTVGWVFSTEAKPIGRDNSVTGRRRLVTATHVEFIRPAQTAEIKAMFADVIDVVADARVQKLLVYVSEQGVVETGRAQRMLMTEFKIKERMARATISNAVSAKLLNREAEGSAGDMRYKLTVSSAGERLLAESDDLPEDEEDADFESLPTDDFNEDFESFDSPS